MEVQVGVLVTTPALLAPLGAGVVVPLTGAVRYTRLRCVVWIDRSIDRCLSSGHQRGRAGERGKKERKPFRIIGD